MRFPNIKVKRIIGKKLCYWLPENNIIIIDHGYQGGDIHIYKHVKSIKADKLKDILADELNNSDLSTQSNLDLFELIRNEELKPEIFQTI